MFHIHNGESTAGTLREFGFPGEHYAFQEVLMAGPTPSGLSPDDWLTIRANYLSAAYDLNFDDCRKNLLKQEATLSRFSEHEETVLWFEHDLFCQINLIYLLDWFSKQSLYTTKLSLICIGEFPGVEDFRGLGQLTGEQLASLFDGRHQVTEREFEVATKAWASYCSTDPRDVMHLLDGDPAAMPFLRNALLLHLARFPSVINGVGRIENKSLELISSGAIGFKSLFPKFAGAEPGYGLGDAQFWNELKRLGNSSEPALEILGLGDEEAGVKSSNYHEAVFEITDIGKALLAGELDFIKINGIDLWLGGVHLTEKNTWRWDEERRELVHTA